MGKSGLLMKMRVLLFSLFLVGSLLLLVSAEEEVGEKTAISEVPMEEVELSLLRKAINFLWQKGRVGYAHVWPVSMQLLLISCTVCDGVMVVLAFQLL